MPARLVAALLLTALCAAPAAAGDLPPGTNVIKTDYGFQQLWDRVKTAVGSKKMGIVAQACGSCGAKKRGVEIPGNAVVMVFRNDFAVRMLEASVPAGFEAPMRFYITENADGTATLTYRTPSVLWRPYAEAKLASLAAELDSIFAAIAKEATGP